MRLYSDKKGLAPVVATVILCGMVLVIGISVWSYTYNISQVLGDDYYQGVQNQIDVISERFFVEHVYYNKTTSILDIWVYNFGDVNIQVDVYVKGGAQGSNSTGVLVNHKQNKMIQVSVNATSGNELAVTVISRRQNVEYGTYVVPYS